MNSKILGFVGAVGFLISSPSVAEIPVPVVGTLFEIECSFGSLRAEVTNVKDDAFTYEGYVAGKRYKSTKRVWQLLTPHIYDYRNLGGEESTWELVSGSLEGIADLKIGSSFSAKYESVPDKYSQYGPTSFSYKVVGKKKVSTKFLGDLEVYEIKGRAYRGSWEMNSTIHFTPEFDFYISREYSFSTGQSHRCDLKSIE